MTRGGVAVIGAGLIGQSWSISFARAGFAVRLFDSGPGVAERGLLGIERSLRALDADGLLRGQPVHDVLARVQPVADLGQALAGAVHVQENTPERIEVKRSVFAELDALAPREAVIASSTSALLPSTFMSELAGAERCLVAHPLNPPHLIPAVEIVPSPRTSKGSVETTIAIMKEAGQRPFALTHEVEGFVMNRLQGALLDEAMMLVAQGYAGVADIDTAMRDGLARRWAFIGPFETIDLNAPNGIEDFLDRYGAAYAEIGRHRPNRPAWQGQLAEQVVAARRALLPAERLAERQAWRDKCLARLAALLQTVEP